MKAFYSILRNRFAFLPLVPFAYDLAMRKHTTEILARLMFGFTVLVFCALLFEFLDPLSFLPRRPAALIALASGFALTGIGIVTAIGIAKYAKRRK
jgi:hypothetical protein